MDVQEDKAMITKTIVVEVVIEVSAAVATTGGTAVAGAVISTMRNVAGAEIVAAHPGETASVAVEIGNMDHPAGETATGMTRAATAADGTSEVETATAMVKNQNGSIISRSKLTSGTKLSAGSKKGRTSTNTTKSKSKLPVQGRTRL